MAPMAPVIPGGGNTNSPPKEEPKKRCNASKKWCFTLNNPTEKQMEYLNGSKFLGLCEILSWQMEKVGCLHAQGAIKFKDKQRPMECCEELLGAHWKKMIDKGFKAFNYCCKEDTRVEPGVIHGFVPPVEVRTLTELWPWQKEIEDLCLTEADDRKILWLWEETGNTGKSAFCKYMCLKRGAIVLSGKTSDIMHGIIKWQENTGHWPEIILVDVPREGLEYINYGALEKVKDGCFYSGKYEGGMCVMNCPHVVFMANEPPRTESMSADRWDVRVIEDKRLVSY